MINFRWWRVRRYLRFCQCRSCKLGTFVHERTSSQCKVYERSVNKEVFWLPHLLSIFRDRPYISCMIRHFVCSTEMLRRFHVRVNLPLLFWKRGFSLIDDAELLTWVLGWAVCLLCLVSLHHTFPKLEAVLSQEFRFPTLAPQENPLPFNLFVLQQCLCSIFIQQDFYQPKSASSWSFFL